MDEDSGSAGARGSKSSGRHAAPPRGGRLKNASRARVSLSLAEPLANLVALSLRHVDCEVDLTDGRAGADALVVDLEHEAAVAALRLQGPVQADVFLDFVRKAVRERWVETGRLSHVR